MSDTELRRHLSAEQIVARMSDRERETYHQNQRKLDDVIEARQKQAAEENEVAKVKQEEKLMDRFEKGMYGNMTQVQLQQAHSELDHFSRGQ